MPQKLHCQVEQVIPHGERVYSLILQPERPLMRFFPGQFLHLTLDEYQPGDFWPTSRPFSIASPPAERDRLRITYAVKGNFTSRMEAELQPGRFVWVMLPFGDFVVTDVCDVCLLAGGTGITAFTAFLAGLGADYPYAVSLFYGARRAELLIYRSLAEEAARRCPNLRAYFLAGGGNGFGERIERIRQSGQSRRDVQAERIERIERGGQSGRGGQAERSERGGQSGRTEQTERSGRGEQIERGGQSGRGGQIEWIGRIEPGLVWERLAKPRKVHYYLSGPPAMLHGLAAGLRKLGAPEVHLHIDAWE